MDRARLDDWCEKGILGLILALLVFPVLATGGVDNDGLIGSRRSLEWLIVQGLMCGVLLLWLLRFWTRTNYRMLFPPACWGVLVFVIYVIVSYSQATVEYTARVELLKVIVYAFAFFAILDNLHGQERIQTLTFALVFLGMAVSLYALYQFITDSPYVWHFRKPVGYAHRGSGTYICPNHLAGFLEMVLPLSLAGVLIGRFKPTTKVFLGYAAVAMLAGIGVTISRAGWAATGLSLSLLFVILLRNRTFRLPALAVIVLLVVGGVFFAKKADQPQKRVDKLVVDGAPRDIRFRLWGPTLRIWQDHLWWGAGPGHFDQVFPKYRPHDVQMRPQYAHNDYLNTLADYGVAGAGIIIVVLGLLALNTVSLWKFVQRSNDITTKPSNRSAFVLGAAIGLAAILIHSIVDFNMHIPANALVAVALMGILSAHARFATERYWINPGWFGRLLATLVVLAGLIYLVRETASGAAQYARYAQSKRARTNEAKVAALKQAYEADPMNFEITYELGEVLRVWNESIGLPMADPLAQEAIQWFERGIQLNPFDGYNHTRIGKCLHLLNRKTEARSHFEKSVELDPNNYYIVAMLGWHFYDSAQFAEAKPWFEKSKWLANWRLDTKGTNDRDTMPAFYLRDIERRLSEKKAEH